MIEYNIITRKNPVTKEVKYSAVPKHQEPVDRQQFLEEMAMESTVTEHDVKLVLSSLQQHIWNNLRNGRSVRLGDLGSFHITLSNRTADTEEDFKASNIEKVNVRFVPSTRLKYQLSTEHPYVKFSRAAKTAASASTDGTEQP